MGNPPCLYLVVPCYNEGEIINESAQVLSKLLCRLTEQGKISPSSRALFVDDGSRDDTWEKLRRCAEEVPSLCAVRLAHNSGHQNALTAGLMTALQSRCDCAVSLDCDLQDDIGVIPEFLDKFMGGCDIVYGVRDDRRSDSFFKRKSADFFYWLMGRLVPDTVKNHADFRLMSARALEALSQYNEVNLFLRGIVPMLGFDSACVYYARKKRIGGKPKYSLSRMAALAADGITSFSVKPLRLISALGIVISALSVLGLLYSLISKPAGGAAPGWTAIVASVWLLGGIQLLCVGVCGAYIGKIYAEVKARPRYYISDRLGAPSDDTRRDEE